MNILKHDVRNRADSTYDSTKSSYKSYDYRTASQNLYEKVVAASMNTTQNIIKSSTVTTNNALPCLVDKNKNPASKNSRIVKMSNSSLKNPKLKIFSGKLVLAAVKVNTSITVKVDTSKSVSIPILTSTPLQKIQPKVDLKKTIKTSKKTKKHIPRRSIRIVGVRETRSSKNPKS